MCKMSDEIKVINIFSIDSSITAVKGKKNGILCGTKRGSIHMLIESRDKFKMEQL